MLDKFKELIRPLITFLFAAAFIYLAIIGKVSVEAFTGLVTLVVKYWFDSREQEKTAQPATLPTPPPPAGG